MKRRAFIAAVAVPALGALAACGSDGSGASPQTSDSTAEPPAATEPAPTAPVVPEPVVTEAEVAPTAPDAVAPSGDPVLSYTASGGFTTREFAFQNPPIALLTAGGSLIGAAVSPTVFPGPLLPQHDVRTVSPAGVEALLAAADAAGLLADVDYTDDQELLIADASTTVLTITADGERYTHEAYALGVGGGPGEGGNESTPERQALLDFVTALQVDPASIIGAANLGDPVDYDPVALQLIATPAEDLSGLDPAPTILEWPAESGIELATSSECTETDDVDLIDVLEVADQLTYFSEGDVTYQVIARPAYPGRSC